MLSLHLSDPSTIGAVRPQGAVHPFPQDHGHCALLPRRTARRALRLASTLDLQRAIGAV